MAKTRDNWENIIPKATVFHLMVYTTCNRDEWDQKLPRYPKCKLIEDDLGLYSSLKNAESAILKYDFEEEDDIVGFKIIEEAIDMSFDNLAPVTERVYNHKKEKIDEQLLNQNHINNFFGRPKEKIRFEVGDFVEFIYEEELQIGIVAKIPHTPENVLENEDDFDDIYIVLPIVNFASDIDKYYLSPCNIFEPRTKILKEIQKDLKIVLKDFFQKPMTNII